MERIQDSRGQERPVVVLPPESDRSRLLGLALIGFTGGVLGSLAMNVYARVVRSATRDGKRGRDPGGRSRRTRHAAAAGRVVLIRMPRCGWALPRIGRWSDANRTPRPDDGWARSLIMRSAAARARSTPWRPTVFPRCEKALEVFTGAWCGRWQTKASFLPSASREARARFRWASTPTR